jgi:hypothetical protein
LNIDPILNWLKGIDLSTMIVRTGSGGLHLYFWILQTIISNKTGKESNLTEVARLMGLKEVDVRGEGGIVFAPGDDFTNDPEIHHAHPYQIVNDVEIAEIMESEYNSLLENLMIEKKTIQDTNFGRSMRRGFLDILEGKFKIDHITQHETGLDEYLYWEGFWREYINCVGKPEKGYIQLQQTQPEFDAQETTRRIPYIKSPEKCPSRVFYNKLFPQYAKQQPIQEDEDEDIDEFPYLIYGILRVRKDTLNEIREMTTEEKETGKKDNKITKIHHNKPADDLSQICDLLTINNHFIATDRLFCWNGYKYSDDISILKCLIEKIFRYLKWGYKPIYATQIIDILSQRCDLHDTDGTILNNFPNLVPFKNGYYNIKDQRKEIASPNIYFTYAFEFDYIEDDIIPAFFLHWIEEVLPNEQDREFYLTYQAYCMTASIDYQIALINHGGGNDGKSTAMDLWGYIWGNLTTGVSLQDFETNPRFSKIMLRGKLKNIIADLPNAALQDDGIMKEVITDHVLIGEEKNHPATKWWNTTKHEYGCNLFPLPPLHAGYAFYRRLKIIEWTETFIDEKDSRWRPEPFDLPPHIHRKDPTMLSQLQTESARILSYLIKHYLSKQKLLVVNWEETRDAWENHSDNCLVFFRNCDITTDLDTETTHLYRQYKEWCKDHNEKIQSRKHFGQVFADEGYSPRQKDHWIESINEDGQVIRQKLLNWYYEGIVFVPQ